MFTFNTGFMMGNQSDMIKTTPKDPLQVLIEPIIRSMAEKLKDAFNKLIKDAFNRFI